MERFYSLLIILFVASSCHFERELKLKVFVKDDQGKAISSAKIKINNESFQDVNNKGLLIYKYHSKKEEDYLKIKIIDKDLNTLKLPILKMVPIPKWYEDSSLHLTFFLKSLKLSEKKNILISRISQNVSSHNSTQASSQPTQEIYIKDIERDIGDNSDTSSFLESEENRENTPKEHENKRQDGHNNDFQSLSHSQKKEISVSLETLFKRRALKGVKISLSKNRGRSFFEIGESDEQGKFNYNFDQGDILHEYLVFTHSCCSKKHMSLARLDKKSSSKIELDDSGYSFSAVDYSYGLEKNLSKTELLLDGLKVDVSEKIGIVHTKKDVNEIELSNLLLNQSHFKIDKLKKSNKLNYKLFATLKVPSRARVGVVEYPRDDGIEDNQLWRAFRREFLSRLLSSQNFKAYSSGVTKKLLLNNDINLKYDFRSGWHTKELAHDLDFLIVFNRNNALSLTAIDKFGNVFFEEAYSLENKIPEELAVNAYEKFSSEFPFEGGVLETSKDKVKINLGKNFHIHKNDTVFFLGAESVFKPQEKVELLGTVISVEDKRATVKLLSKEAKVHKNLRVLRVGFKLSKNYLSKLDLDKK